MNKALKYSAIILLILFGVLQFFRAEYPETREINPGDIFQSIEASVEVTSIIKAACYDCHSMETNYPWYSQVAPLSWWIIDHVVEGRDELNFSNFDGYEKRRKLRKLKEIAEEVEKEKMPMPSYLRGHPEARLSDDQRALIQDWANQSAKDLLKNSTDK